MKMHRFSVRNIFLYLLLTINCSTIVKIPIVKSFPQGFEESMGNGRNLGLSINKSEDFSYNTGFDWKRLIQGSVVNKFIDKRYFKIIDIGSREVRLKEIAFSQMMGVSKDFTKDLPIDILLYIEIPQDPIYECKKYTNFIVRQECQQMDNMGRCLRYVQRRFPEYTKELTYTVFVKAKMIHLESGRNLEYTNTEPAILKKTSSSPNFDCPSALEALNEALNLAGEEIVEKLSPVMEELEVPILKDDSGVKESNFKKEIVKLISSGNKWLDTEKPNIDLAKKDWDQALQLSGGSSSSALWNLGVYFWYKGDFSRADDYFKKSIAKAEDEDWLDSKKRDTLSVFEAEKSRTTSKNKSK
jgi:hypothetical protein